MKKLAYTKPGMILFSLIGAAGTVGAVIADEPFAFSLLFTGMVFFLLQALEAFRCWKNPARLSRGTSQIAAVLWLILAIYLGATVPSFSVLAKVKAYSTIVSIPVSVLIFGAMLFRRPQVLALGYGILILGNVKYALPVFRFLAGGMRFATSRMLMNVFSTPLMIAALVLGIVYLFAPGKKILSVIGAVCAGLSALAFAMSGNAGLESRTPALLCAAILTLSLLLVGVVQEPVTYNPGEVYGNPKYPQ